MHTSIQVLQRTVKEYGLHLVSGLFVISIIVSGVTFRFFYDFLVLSLLIATAYSVGSLFNLYGYHKKLTQIIFQTLIGLLIISIFIWISTFYNYGYKNIFIVLSLMTIAFRRKQTINSIYFLGKVYKLHYKSNLLFTLIWLVFIVAMLILASYPISTYDALTKHINIPTKILASSNYDYNVIESVTFGDSALFAHMIALYFLALGSAKAIIFFLVFLYCIAITCLLLILRKSKSGKYASVALSVLAFSTPISLKLIIDFHVDPLQLPFLFFPLLLLTNSSNLNISKNFLFILFLLGGAFFTKQTSSFLAFPLILIIMFFHLRSIVKKQISVYYFFVTVAAGAALFLLPSIGPLAIITYKTGNPFFPYANGLFGSPYFSIHNFVDPFRNPLGFDFGSLLSIVLHTDKNMEIGPYSLGFYLLALPATFIVICLKRKIGLLLCLLSAVLAYFISTFLSYNIRYFFQAIVLLMLPTAWCLQYLCDFLKQRHIKIALQAAILLTILVPNFYYLIVTPKLKGEYVRLHNFNFYEKITISPTNRFFKYIPNNSRVLLNSRHPFRSTFPGFLCSTSWHNTFMVTLVKNGSISFRDLLFSFDYMLDNRNPGLRFFSDEIAANMDILDLSYEDNNFKMYRINKPWKLAFKAPFTEPLDITITQIKSYPVETLGTKTKFKIVAEIDGQENKDRYGRYQINWVNKNTGKGCGLTLQVFHLEPGKHEYTSIIDTPFAENCYAHVYITSHNTHPIRIHSYELYRQPAGGLKPYLDEYNRKWPHLAKVITP